jgi:hypothetical protein
MSLVTPASSSYFRGCLWLYRMVCSPNIVMFTLKKILISTFYLVIVGIAATNAAAQQPEEPSSLASSFFQGGQFDPVIQLGPSNILHGWQLGIGSEFSPVDLVFDEPELPPSLDLQARRELSEALDILMRYRVSYLDALGAADDDEPGLMQHYSAEANMKWSVVRTRVGLSLETGDWQDADGLSPTHQSWIAAVSLTPFDDLDVHLGFDYRNSDYFRAKTLEHQEDRFRTVLGFSYMLSGDAQLSTEYQHMRQVSTDEAYDTDVNDMILLNVTMGF